MRCDICDTLVKPVLASGEMGDNTARKERNMVKKGMGERAGENKDLLELYETSKLCFFEALSFPLCLYLPLCQLPPV